jgi:TolB-like protein/Flp pilus assembly protein TadD
MEGESPKSASTPPGAVFLSYASQDADAAKRICEALRAAGIEVWFDQSELRGGDAWDQSIRKQIKTCALFLPIISKHTHERAEGYFRLEWKLAVDRSHLIMANKPFLVPVVIDDTPDDDENLPEKFREMQWTRLPSGVTQPEFVERIKGLLSPEPPTTSRLPAGAASGSSPIPPTTGLPSPLRRAVPITLAVVAVAAIGYLLADKLGPKHGATAPPATSGKVTTSPPGATAAFNPPPYSIAVLPFVNMSGDKDQEYFSEGLTEELLNSLSRINELQVAARTSSFSFQGEHPDISTVAHKLNVASVLEGSVRRSGRTIRVTVQLNNALTGFHLWSETYDRDLGDVLKLQTDIANAVTGALKIRLLGDDAAKIEIGGTHNPAAFDAYLRASKAYWEQRDERDAQLAIDGYTDAIRLDRDYALAYAARSLAVQNIARYWTATPSARRAGLDKAQADARKAIALVPDLSEGHLALAMAYLSGLDFKSASEACERALALGPGNARVLRDCGELEVRTGNIDSGLRSLKRALALDPLNRNSHAVLGTVLLDLRRYPEALAAYKEADALASGGGDFAAVIGIVYYLLGDFESARSFCEEKPARNLYRFCLTITYDKLGRHADAETVLAKIRASTGDVPAFGYSMMYAQWGDTARALDWLEAAMRARDPYFDLKFPLLDPLRNEPRFQAIERELKFPN